MKDVLRAIIMLTAALSNVVFVGFGQNANESPKQNENARARAISGRIVNEDGNPLPNARVFINRIGGQTMRRTITTDDAGRFVAEELPRGNYMISAQANGYTQARNPGDTVYYKPGDTVNLILKKGGVITGSITTSDGEPVVCVTVSATQILDEFGRRTTSTYAVKYTD